MSHFIEGYAELKMQPLATPMGTDWYADETVLVAGVIFEKDLSSLFPYLNGVLQKERLDHEGRIQEIARMGFITPAPTVT